jgi:quercetin dioxygenase-like cupin family protein
MVVERRIHVVVLGEMLWLLRGVVHVVVLGEMLWLLRGVVHVVGEMSGSCYLVW